MANFDFNNLYLVNPCELNDECYSRAMHAYNIIDDSKIFNSFKESIEELDYLIATSSIDSKSDKKHLRNPILLENLSKKIYEIDGKVGLVFGREDYGLFNEEIASCDIMLKIPTSEKYPSMNLSHSVAVVLYTLYISKKNQTMTKRTIGKIEKEKLFNFFSDLLDQINYPEHKKENTKIMFKRIMGRAMPSKWEYHTLMGVLSGSLDKIKGKNIN
jgi:TrmH family RNA methyltransferase